MFCGSGRRLIAPNFGNPRTMSTTDILISTIATVVAALDHEQVRMEQCHNFVNLMKLDDEVKVADCGERGSLDRLNTPDRDGYEDRNAPISGISRDCTENALLTLLGTADKKKRGQPPLNRSRSSRKCIDGDGDDDDDD